MLKRLVLLSALVHLSTPVAAVFAAEPIRLQFELFRNGAQEGQPLVAVQDGQTRSLTMTGDVQLSFTPQRLSQDEVRVALTVTAAGKKGFSGSLVLKNRLAGSIGWKSATGRDAYEVKITHLQ